MFQLRVRVMMMVCGLAGGIASAQPAWVVEPSPNVEGASSTLYAVAVVGENDAWAVGDADPGVNEPSNPLAMRWDGSGWSIVEVPNPAHPLKPECQLYGADALAPDDVWGVGQFVHPDELDYETFVVHFDGDSWSWIPSPTEVNGEGSALYAVEAIASDDVWAVGDWPGAMFGAVVDAAPLAIRWDGSEWTPYEVPFNPPGEFFDETRLGAVSAVSANSVWAIGGHTNQTIGVSPFIVHFDGNAWSIMEDRPEPIFHSVLDIHAFADDDLWIAGYLDDGNDALPFVGDPIFIHWDGASWSYYENPGVFDFAAIAPDDIYAAGGDLLAHWDGASWTVVGTLEGDTPPNPQILSMDTAAGAVWGVGRAGVPGEPVDTLTARVVPEGGCAADFNADGALNILDFVAFQNAFVGGDASADCDGSNSLNILDFVCFQNLFQAGCP